MKKIFLILLFAVSIYPQSDLLLLMGDDAGIGEYPITADLIHSYDEREMTVSSWADQTGSVDWVQATAGLQPIKTANALNGYSGLLFDGVDNCMLTSTLDFVISQPYTIYMIIKQATWTNTDEILNGANQCKIAQLSSTPRVCMQSPDATIYLEPELNTYKILSMVFSGASSSMQLDSLTASIYAGNPGGGDFGYSGYANYLGSGYEGATPANIEIVALYFHNTAHDASTKATIINWLNSKYGVF